MQCKLNEVEINSPLCGSGGLALVLFDHCPLERGDLDVAWVQGNRSEVNSFKLNKL